MPHSAVFAVSYDVSTTSPRKGLTMTIQMIADAIPATAFGRRKIVPRVCIADGKPHIRNFLREALEELGFIVTDCSDAAKIADAVIEHQSDLVVLGLSAGGIAANAQLEALREVDFRGRVLVFGPPASPIRSIFSRTIAACAKNSRTCSRAPATAATSTSTRPRIASTPAGCCRSRNLKFQLRDLKFTPHPAAWPA